MVVKEEDKGSVGGLEFMDRGIRLELPNFKMSIQGKKSENEPFSKVYSTSSILQGLGDIFAKQ